MTNPWNKFIPVTRSLITKHVPCCLGDMIIDFLLPAETYGSYGIAKSGVYELLFRIGDPNAAMAGACAAGDINLVKKMLLRGARSFNISITEACRYKQIQVGELMKEKGAWICHIHGRRCETFGELLIKLIPIAANYLMIRDGSACMRYT